MGHDERQGLWPVSTLMNEVDRQSADHRPELRQSIETSFLRPPIELFPPVLYLALHEGDARAVFPPFDIQ
jgi:hypothetical protein